MVTIYPFLANANEVEKGNDFFHGKSSYFYGDHYIIQGVVKIKTQYGTEN